MPIVKNIKGACEHYRIPYPLDQQGLQCLYTAIMYQHPEAKGTCNLRKIVCGTCLYYTDQSGCTYNWAKHASHKIATYYEPCSDCPQYCVRSDVYLLDLKPEDLRF